MEDQRLLARYGGPMTDAELARLPSRCRTVRLRAAWEPRDPPPSFASVSKRQQLGGVAVPRIPPPEPAPAASSPITCWFCETLPARDIGVPVARPVNRPHGEQWICEGYFCSEACAAEWVRLFQPRLWDAWRQWQRGGRRRIVFRDTRYARRVPAGREGRRGVVPGKRVPERAVPLPRER